MRLGVHRCVLVAKGACKPHSNINVDVAHSEVITIIYWLVPHPATCNCEIIASVLTPCSTSQATYVSLHSIANANSRGSTFSKEKH